MSKECGFPENVYRVSWSEYVFAESPDEAADTCISVLERIIADDGSAIFQVEEVQFDGGDLTSLHQGGTHTVTGESFVSALESSPEDDKTWPVLMGEMLCVAAKAGDRSERILLNALAIIRKSKATKLRVQTAEMSKVKESNETEL